MLIAIVALVFATTGISVAATSGDADDVRADSGKNQAQTAASKRGPRGPRGLRGYRGYQGPAGPAGAAGPAGSPGVLGLTTVDGAELLMSPGQYGGAPRAECPAGSTVVGTGFNGPFGGTVGGFVLAYGTFVGGFFANQSSIPLDGYVQAICAKLPPGATVASNRAKAAALTRYKRDVAAATARLRGTG